MKKLTSLFIISALFTQSGCAVLGFSEVLAASEVAALGTAERTVLTRLISRGVLTEGAFGGIFIADEAALYSELRTLRMTAGSIYKKPQLYYRDAGKNIFVADVLSNNSLRFLQTGEVINLYEGSALYRAHRSAVNVRSGAGTNYKAFTTVQKDELVIVVDKNAGWKKIKIGADEFGWISENYLTPVINNEINSIPPPSANNNKTVNNNYTNQNNDDIIIKRTDSNIRYTSTPGTNISNNDFDWSNEVIVPIENNTNSQSINSKINVRNDVNLTGSNDMEIFNDVNHVNLAGSGDIRIVGNVLGNIVLLGSGDVNVNGSVYGNVTIMGSGDVYISGKLYGTRSIMGTGKINAR